VDEIVQLWQHQRDGVERAFTLFKETEPAHFAYFFEQGTGKTLTTITLMRRIFEHHKRPLMTLILCPQIVIKNWYAEIDRFSRCGQMVQLLTGPKEKRLRDLHNGVKTGKRIFVTNLEALATVDGLLWETRRKGKQEVRVPIDHKWEMLVVDEIHRLKNPTAKSTKMAIKIADRTFFKYGLTGTPIANNELDLWAPFRILDGGELLGKNYLAFKREFFFDENAGMIGSQRYWPSWKIRPGSAEILAKKIQWKSMRVTKEECLDLPPLVKQVLTVEMSPKQRRAYEEMKRDFITYLDSGVATASIAIVKALRLQQIASGFVKLEDGQEIYFPDAPRLNALEELLSDAGGKVIVWCAFKQNYDAVRRVCAKLGRSITFITGEQSQAEKDQAERDFTKGDIQTLCANPAAGGTGVNLVEAPLAIWFSRSFKAVDRWQAIARNHRGGSEMHAKVTMIDLVAEQSIDSHVLEALDRKETIAEGILSWRERV
jgi:SNF2 family DNA or RNA helicase